jgi:hypothetical protein
MSSSASPSPELLWALLRALRRSPVGPHGATQPELLVRLCTAKYVEEIAAQLKQKGMSDSFHFFLTACQRPPPPPPPFDGYTSLGYFNG